MFSENFKDKELQMESAPPELLYVQEVPTGTSKFSL
jgi:hypothetical protein